MTPAGRNPAGDLHRALAAVLREEERFLTRKDKEPAWKAAVLGKVPDGLRSTLELAFEKAFEGVFLHGTGLIEKTFPGEDLRLEHRAADLVVESRPTRKNLKRMGKPVSRGNLMNSAFTTACGLGMGLAGLGIPDIPLLTAALLQGVYRTAAAYGFSYEGPGDRVFILRLLRAALAPEEQRQGCFLELNGELPAQPDLPGEMKRTAKVLSDALLLEKFIQGIPLVGAVGAVVNNIISRRVLHFAAIQYKKRYLQGKIARRDPAGP